MAPSSHDSWLNSDVALAERLAQALRGAHGLDVAVAYLKRSGAATITGAGLPACSRFVVGTGFGLTDQEAAESLAETGADVRAVIGSEAVSARASPKALPRAP